METFYNIKQRLSEKGFAIIENVFTIKEIDLILQTIAQVDNTNPTFRKTNDLFAIRQFFKEVPGAFNMIFNVKLNLVISQIFTIDYFVAKSIYFDKPGQSNLFLAYHQDLCISVNKRLDLAGYGPWTTKQNQFAVQPPLDILENNYTIRIHLDDTDENNGSLKVIASSHLKGVYRTETIDCTKETVTNCSVKKGGIMIMKPLLLHASKRRVIHVEFSNCLLADTLQWSEMETLQITKGLRKNLQT